MENLTILWLDDQRDPYKYLNTKSTSATFARNKKFYDGLLKNYHANFVWVKNLYQFIDYIEKNGIPQFVSFDHDLNNRGGGEGLSDEQKLNNNGVNCAKWLVNYCKKMGEPLPKFYVHSANPKHGPEINRVLTSENTKKKRIIRLTEDDFMKTKTFLKKNISLKEDTEKNYAANTTSSNATASEIVNKTKQEHSDADAVTIPGKEIDGSTNSQVTTVDVNNNPQELQKAQKIAQTMQSQGQDVEFKVNLKNESVIRESVTFTKRELSKFLRSF